MPEGLKLEIACPLLQELHAYWEAKRRGRLFPRRSDLSPAEMMLALPHVFLVDVEHGEKLGFRIRLAGTYIEEAFRQVLTGTYLEQVKLNAQTEDIVARYEWVVREQRPVVSCHRFVNEDERQFDYERLLLPLAVDDENRVDMILGAICFAKPLPTPYVPFIGVEPPVPSTPLAVIQEPVAQESDDRPG